MAFTKIVGAGIHTLSNVHSHNINSSGIITATSFVGPFNGSDGDFSGNVTIDGNLTVNGTTSTIDTNLIGVDKIEVTTAGSNVAVAVTHNGTGDLIRLYDGSSQVVTVDDEGKVGINSAIPTEKLDVVGNIKASGTITGSSFVGALPISNDGNDRVITATGTTGTLNAESNFTYNGSSCTIKGTTDGVLNLDTTDSRGSFIRFQKDGTTKVWVGSGQGLSLGDLDDLGLMATDNIIMRTGSDEKLRITSGGTVNIGGDYTNTSGKLKVTGDVSIATGDIAFLNNGHKIHNGSSSGNVTIQGGATYAGGRIVLSGGSGSGTGDIRFYADTTTTPVERLRITSAGKVGIGTFSGLNYNLEVQGSGQQTILVGSQNASGALLVLDGDSNGDGAGGDYSYIAHNSSGDMLIATDNPNGNSDIVFRAGADDEKVRIKEDGKVGIGTDTPNGDLQIRTGANASFRVLADPSTSGLFVGNYGSGDGYRSLSLLGSNIRLYTITAGALSGAVQRVHITPTGQVGVGTDTVRNNRTMQITGESGTTLLLTGFAPGIHFNGQTSTDSSDNDRSAIGQASGSNHFLNGSSSGDTVLRGTSSGKLLFGIGTAVKMQLNSAGKLGIGVAPSTGVDIGYDVHIKKGSSEPNGKLIIQSHDTANSNAQIQLLARDNSNNNETCVIKAMNASVSSQIDLWLYTNDNTNQSIKLTGNDGAAYFQGVNSSGLTYQFYNAASGGSSDTRVLIKTYSNQGADPYIKFDSGGSNHVVGQLYAGTTNNKLVLGVGESPSGGVSGIHIAGDGNTQVTNHIYMTKSADPRIYSGSSVGLNIDGQALYLNRYVNSTIAMGRGGGAVEVSNTNSGNDSQLNIYKSSGGDTDDAILRVGYDSSNCLSIQRQRNSSQIKIDYNQNDAILRFQANGDDAMILTNRQNVNIAKFTPLATHHRAIVDNTSWAGSRPVKFYMRFSTGNFSGSYHVARMISQHDWGFADWQVSVLRDYYSPDTHDGALTRYTGYYNSHSETIVTYNMRSNSPDIYGDGRRLSKNTNLGVSGAHQIHTASNGGYYKDAYATDYYINLGTYSGVMLEVTVNNPGGYLKDTSTTLTDTYPAAFGASVADQATADAWNGAVNGGGGRGLWFNVRQGVLDSSWTGAGTSGNAYNYGDSNLPIS